MMNFYFWHLASAYVIVMLWLFYVLLLSYV